MPNELRRRIGQAHETGRLRHRQRPQQDLLKQREDGNVHADAERERQHGNRRERLLPAQRSERIAEIGERVLDRSEGERGAHAVLGLLHAAELDARGSPRFRFTHPSTHLLGGRSLDVVLKIGIERALDLVTPEQPAYECANAVQDRHAPCSTAVIAALTRSHRVSACSSSLRPNEVSE